MTAAVRPLPAANAFPAFDPASLLPLGLPVTSLSLDSRRVRPGDVFVACPGRSRDSRHDGRSFIAQAIERGAAGVLWETSGGFRWNARWQLPNLPLAGLHANLGALASHVYGHPSRSLQVIAVTGTNGKTSVVRWIAQALASQGCPCAVIGTLGAGYPDGPAMDELANTTPDAITVHAALAGFVRDGARAVALEASSIALDQHRLDAVEIDIAVFTNLTREHLDYHASMQAYGEAKAALFDWPTLSRAVINLDDAFGRELAARVRARGLPVLGFGLRASDAQIAGHDLQLGRRGLQLEIVTGSARVTVANAVIGEFNASNLLAAAGALVAAGVEAGALGRLLGQVSAAPGRMQQVRAAEPDDALPDAAEVCCPLPMVVVDYAHTPDALANVLATLRAMLPDGGALICVFGCGGDRDPGKRAEMGAIAARLADRVWVTSDNPRSEPPARIIDEVVAGIPASLVVDPAADAAADPAAGPEGSTRPHPRVYREVDREQAIGRAIAEAGTSDIVLIAGKGHETWQEIAGVRHPFDDRAVAAARLGARLRTRLRGGG